MSKTPSQLVFVPSMAISQHDRIAVFPCFESPVVSYEKLASQQRVGRHVFDIVLVGVKGGGKVGHVGGWRLRWSATAQGPYTVRWVINGTSGAAAALGFRLVAKKRRRSPEASTRVTFRSFPSFLGHEALGARARGIPECSVLAWLAWCLLNRRLYGVGRRLSIWMANG